MTDLSSFWTCSGPLHDSADSTRANMLRDLHCVTDALRGPQASVAGNVEESQRLMLSLAISPHQTHTHGAHLETLFSLGWY